MSTNLETTGNKKYYLEIIKWLFVFILLIVVIMSNYIYHNGNILLKIFLNIFIIILASIVAITTNKGKVFISFAREARIEIRKVIWPSRQETLYTTIIVIIATILMSLILWGLDSILVHLVSFITNLRL